jgi:hypothetical protein
MGDAYPCPHGVPIAYRFFCLQTGKSRRFS